MKMIAAVDSNWGIGFENNLLFRIPDDMKNFRKLTKASGIVIMGRKTYESMDYKPLKGRMNIILGSNLVDPNMDNEEMINSGTSVVWFNKPEYIMDFLTQSGDGDLFNRAFVIGGQSIFDLFFWYCDSFFITQVDASMKADRFFYNLDEIVDTFKKYHNGQFTLLIKSEVQHWNNLNYTYSEYYNFVPKKYNKGDKISYESDLYLPSGVITYSDKKLEQDGSK